MQKTERVTSQRQSSTSKIVPTLMKRPRFGLPNTSWSELKFWFCAGLKPKYHG